MTGGLEAIFMRRLHPIRYQPFKPSIIECAAISWVDYMPVVRLLLWEESEL